MDANAKKNDYYLCPDDELLETLLQGLKINYDRYGYGACPCRIASGNKQYETDIICPCEYRDADVNEFGMCYCGLFVNEKVHQNPKLISPIPERRPIEIQDAAMEKHKPASKKTETTTQNESENIQIWRCTVCGYLAARKMPPPICPICKAKADRFTIFKI